MKKLFKTLAIVAIFGIVAFAGSAWAQSNQSAFTTAVDSLASVFRATKQVFFVLAAFGLIGMAAAALLGKIQWKWLWALVFGVAIVAGAGMIIETVTGEQLDTRDSLQSFDSGY